ncbi:tRNA pseudouridine(38-40) synthase TruA [Mobilisporobacter senegalensis]|nr:tRNA pseudouridine(38-40) synthase TruA [Mobilisporobacter senegalensis]
MTIMYDGSGYSGWQRLGKKAVKESIQGCIEESLSSILNEKVKIIGASRTDQGVHAYGMAANFHTKTMIDLEEIKKELNGNLKDDIRILKIEEVNNNFHSRYSARCKTYIYKIDNRDKGSVFHRKYTHHHQGQLDIKNMQTAANYLIGKHDFKGFSSQMNDNRTTIREIYSLTISREGQNIIITIKGNGFLYNMVRIISGTLIEVGEGKMKPKEIRKILDTKDRSLAGPKAEFQGLTLKEIEY